MIHDDLTPKTGNLWRFDPTKNALLLLERIWKIMGVNGGDMEEAPPKQGSLDDDDKPVLPIRKTRKPPTCRAGSVENGSGVMLGQHRRERGHELGGIANARQMTKTSTP